MSYYYNRDKHFEMKFRPQQKEILSKIFRVPVEDVVDAPEIEDMEHNTDLIVTARNGTKLRIACRVRKSNYIYYFDIDFSLRGSRSYGSKTEVEKIYDKWGDGNLYCFSDGDKITAWTFGDLSVFRKIRPEPYDKKMVHGTEMWLYRYSDIHGYLIAKSTSCHPQYLTDEYLQQREEK